MRSLRTSVIALFTVAGLASAAFAQSAPTGMNILISQVGGPQWQWQNSQSTGTWTPPSASNPNQWQHAGSINNAFFGASWNLDLDQDPFISNNFALTNNTATVQTYSITVVLPVAPSFPSPSTTFGSISGSLGDTNNDGFAQLTSTASGSAIYSALIDGGTYRQLLADPFSVTTPAVGGATIPFPTFQPNFFSFIGTEPGVSSTIAITNQFTLTPGDSVNIVSTFRIDPVIPAPATMSLLALGGVVAGRRRRN